jgi:homoserine O-acetyltransferase/O-succinyltransferase
MEVVEADLALNDFAFACGATLPTVIQHYRTLGTPRRGPDGEIANAVLLLHGTSGSAVQFALPGVADELFVSGAPLDCDTYYVILPDALGHGGSSKPSDGLRGRFPSYGYTDIVVAQHRLVTEHLGIRRLRLVAGTSMGGMQTWMWGQRYPDAMRALMPIAALPQAVRGRNLLWRRMMIDVIRTDPGYRDGDYDTQPTALGTAWNIADLMTHGVPALQDSIGSTAVADARIAKVTATAQSGQDANDTIYEYAASYDYDPADALDRITAPLLAVNFGDDEVNPNQLGVLQRAIRRVPRGRAVTLAAGPLSDGHHSIDIARLWAPYVREILEQTAEHAAQPERTG